MIRLLVLAVTSVVAAAGLVTLSADRAPAAASDAATGRALFVAGCASCHGVDARGVAPRGPSLRGVGAASIDFYLSTGRMPLSRPGEQPHRATPLYAAAQRRALLTYLTSLGPGGPSIPDVDPGAGSITDGRRLFTDSCSGCHQVVGQGGIAPGLVAPPLNKATPTQIAEAIRVGPYLMPHFSPRQLSAHDVDSIARYVTDVVQSPPNRGGWAIGNIGPIPEGLIAFFLLGGTLVLIARIIGERAP